MFEAVSDKSKPFENDEKLILFHVKSCFRSQDIYSFPGYVDKRLYKNAMVNLKIYNITDWTTSNCNKHFTQYLKKYIQLGNQISSVNKI